MNLPDELTLATILIPYAGYFFVLLIQSLMRRGAVPLAPMVLYLLAAWPIAVNLATQRDFQEIALGGIPDIPENLSSVMLLTGWMSMGVLVALLVPAAKSWLKTGFPSQGRSLWIAFMLFFMAPIVSGLLGTAGSGIEHELFRPFLFVTVVFLTASQYPAFSLRYVYVFCLTYVIGSLVTIIVAPDWALFSGLPGIIGFDSKLYGLARNPNALAPIALLFIFLELSRTPTRGVKHWIFRWVSLSSAWLVILWTQSKTVFAAVLAGFFIKGLYQPDALPRRNMLRKGLLRYLLVVLPALLVLLVLLFFLTGDFLDTFSQLPGIRTFSGRFDLWQITLKFWKESPYFGYGPRIWDEEFRLRFLLEDRPYAGHAHNMFVQVLGETGLFGMMLFLIVVALLTRMAFAAREQSRGFSLSILSLLLIRFISESAFRNRNMDETTFLNMAVFACFIAWNCQPDRKYSVPSSGQGNFPRGPAGAPP